MIDQTITQAMTLDELKARMESDRAELTRRAEAKRDQAAKIVRDAAEALVHAEDEAQQLETEAEELDGEVGPEPVRRAVRKVTLRVGTEEPAAEKPKPARKPRAKKAAKQPTGPRPDGTVVATCALVKKALTALGGKGNKSAIRNQGDFTRASLDVVIKTDDFKTVGKGKGAGTTYKAA